MEFDWMGTTDPTAMLAMPAAIDWMASLDPGGWPALMAANHAFALHAMERLVGVLGVSAPGPDEMIGSMVAVTLPGIATDADALRLKEHLEADRIEIPVVGWPVRAARPIADDPPSGSVVRLAAQRYNDSSDVERLVASLGRWASAE